MSTAEGSATGTDGWTIVVPVKALDRAKSRLDPALPSAGRKALVLAMATDVLLDGVHLETFLPGDASTAAALRRLTAD